MRDLNKSLPLTLIDIHCIVCCKVCKSLCGLKKAHMAVHKKTSPRTESRKMYSRHSICLLSLLKGFQNCNWFEGTSDKGKESVQTMLGNQETAIVCENEEIIVYLTRVHGSGFLFGFAVE